MEPTGEGQQVERQQRERTQQFESEQWLETKPRKLRKLEMHLVQQLPETTSGFCGDLMDFFYSFGQVGGARAAWRASFDLGLDPEVWLKE